MRDCCEYANDYSGQTRELLSCHHLQTKGFDPSRALTQKHVKCHGQRFALDMFCALSIIFTAVCHYFRSRGWRICYGDKAVS